MSRSTSFAAIHSRTRSSLGSGGSRVSRSLTTGGFWWPWRGVMHTSSGVKGSYVHPSPNTPQRYSIWRTCDMAAARAGRRKPGRHVMKLADRVCVITGGARGIGEAIAARFTAEGATVAILDLDGAAAAGTARRLGGTGHDCDVGSRPSVEAAVAEVLQTGVFLCSQIVGRHMLASRRGTIVNISSMNAWEAFPMRLAYCAAKAAVIAMTQVLAIEWADRGIRVNAVAPGVTRTALVQKGIDDGVIDVEAYTARTPQHRFGEPDEIARAVLYLASDEDSSFVTGT